MNTTRGDDCAIERRHCVDHSGTQERLEAMELSQKSNFSTIKWLLGGLSGCFLLVGGYVMGQQSIMDKQIAVNSNRLVTIEKFDDIADKSLSNLEGWKNRHEGETNGKAK